MDCRDDLTLKGTREERAAATLQAATRRMFARRSTFAYLRAQTTASLTIQRNLMRWWTQQHAGGRSNSPFADTVIGSKTSSVL
jgi:hypothetical protein